MSTLPLENFFYSYYDCRNPTPNSNARIWRKYTSDDNFMEYLSNDEIGGRESYDRSKRLAFWTLLLPKIANRKSVIHNTIPTELQKSLGKMNVKNIAVQANYIF